MTISNEPGYYEANNFGIRIENLCYTKPIQTANNFNGKTYLGFETVTMTPIKTDLINVEQLNDNEINWMNNYHTQVREKLIPLMKEFFPETVDYLLKETQPIGMK
jgi:Xaa-Pro aminopeptidase